MMSRSLKITWYSYNKKQLFDGLIKIQGICLNDVCRKIFSVSWNQGITV